MVLLHWLLSCHLTRHRLQFTAGAKPHSFLIEYDEFSMDPAGRIEDISIPMIIMDLQEMHKKAHGLGQLEDITTGDEDEDSEEGLTSIPPISLDEANLHLTALLRLLKTITVTELPKNGRRFKLKMCSISLSDSVSHCVSIAKKIKTKQFAYLAGC
jgi:hypothetical protein